MAKKLKPRYSRDDVEEAIRRSKKEGRPVSLGSNPGRVKALRELADTTRKQGRDLIGTGSGWEVWLFEGEPGPPMLADRFRM